mmetsp:Transcript_19568/g.35889  ORF Transcript_19568/g.35889 Transcript_19568/m.35889 type:complete len:319 (+) Transcript_19568:1737-2693(+)
MSSTFRCEVGSEVSTGPIFRAFDKLKSYIRDKYRLEAYSLFYKTQGGGWRKLDNPSDFKAATAGAKNQELVIRVAKPGQTQPFEDELPAEPPVRGEETKEIQSFSSTIIESPGHKHPISPPPPSSNSPIVATKISLASYEANPTAPISKPVPAPVIPVKKEIQSNSLNPGLFQQKPQTSKPSDSAYSPTKPNESNKNPTIPPPPVPKSKTKEVVDTRPSVSSAGQISISELRKSQLRVSTLISYNIMPISITALSISSQKPLANHSIPCINCKKTIEGYRFYCHSPCDLNFCSLCEGIHDHPVLRFTSPEQASHYFNK